MSVLVVGGLYITDYQGTPWSQPGGIGTQVLPTLGDGPMTSYPVPGQFLMPSAQAIWHPGCGHGCDEWQIFRDFDSDTDMSVAVVTCPICSYVVQLIEPYEEIENYFRFPIIIG